MVHVFNICAIKGTRDGTIAYNNDGLNAYSNDVRYAASDREHDRQTPGK